MARTEEREKKNIFLVRFLLCTEGIKASATDRAGRWGLAYSVLVDKLRFLTCLESAISQK